MSRRLDVYIDGKKRDADVIEYCVSGNWARVYVRDSRGRIREERGKWVVVKIGGKIEPVIVRD